MPRDLSALLAALAVEAGPGEFAAVESAAWIADRVGARMSFETFVANIDSLWFPARDDVVCVLAAADDLMVLVVDHEELITLSRVDSSEHAGQHGCRQISGW
jgi:hypothetical protein